MEARSETDTEHKDSHQDAAPRPGVVSCRRRARLRQVVGHLVSCSCNTLMAALMHMYHRYSRHGAAKLPRFHRCLRGWKMLTPIAAKLCRRRMGAFLLVMFVVQLRPASVANATAGTTNLFSHEFVVPPHCSTRRWTLHENPILRMSPPGVEVVPLDGERRVHFAHGRQGSSPTTSFGQNC